MSRTTTIKGFDKQECNAGHLIHNQLLNLHLNTQIKHSNILMNSFVLIMLSHFCCIYYFTVSII